MRHQEDEKSEPMTPDLPPVVDVPDAVPEEAGHREARKTPAGEDGTPDEDGLPGEEPD